MQLEELERIAAAGDPGRTLDALIQSLQEQQQYSAWFEALKMQARFELGLEIWSLETDEALPLEQQRQLEDRLVQACQKVGEAMIAAGLIRDGWLYLRPVGDAARAKQLLHSIEADEQNVEQLIDVAIGHGVSPAWGFRLLLQRMGTCNAITAFESQMHTAPLSERQAAAADLLNHLYDEVHANVLHHVRQVTAGAANADPSPTAHAETQNTETQSAESIRAETFGSDGADHRRQALPEASLRDLMRGRDDLFANNNYHIDATHLSSAVRIARVVDDAATLGRALELCEYGQRLSSMFQPPGRLPFDPFFAAHRRYFEILLRQDSSESALNFFRQQRQLATAQTLQPNQTFSLEAQIESTEALIEVLLRSDRASAAIDVLLDQLRTCAVHQRSRWTPILFRCCQTLGDFSALRDYSRQADDILGFGLACLYQDAQ